VGQGRARRGSRLTLAVESVAANALAHGHAQVDVEANTGDAHAGIIFVLGYEERVVVGMGVAVRVAGMAACVRVHGSGGGGRSRSCAVNG
jgi:hypothetical protein